MATVANDDEPPKYQSGRVGGPGCSAYCGRWLGSIRHSCVRRFDEVGELYDRARPGYPAGCSPTWPSLLGSGRAVACWRSAVGTGQATRPCRAGLHDCGGGDRPAPRGAGAAEACAVSVCRGGDWRLRGLAAASEPFDAVVAATAFHWVDPAVRVVKAADALRPAGWWSPARSGRAVELVASRRHGSEAGRRSPGRGRRVPPFVAGCTA